MPSPDEMRSTLQTYIKLMCESDIDGILALFADDAYAEDPVGNDPIEGLDALGRWLEAMKSRPACQRGVEVPMRIPNLDRDTDPKAAEEFAKNARKMLQR